MKNLHQKILQRLRGKKGADYRALFGEEVNNNLAWLAHEASYKKNWSERTGKPTGGFARILKRTDKNVRIILGSANSDESTGYLWVDRTRPYGGDVYRFVSVRKPDNLP